MKPILKSAGIMEKPLIRPLHILSMAWKADPISETLNYQLMRFRPLSIIHFPYRLFRNFSSLQFHPDVTFFCGSKWNRQVYIDRSHCIGVSLEGGPKSIQTIMHDNASSLHMYLKLIRSFELPKDYFFLRAESFYNVATYMEEMKDPKYLQGMEEHYMDSLTEWFSLLF